jgi:hypothetical protein
MAPTTLPLLLLPRAASLVVAATVFAAGQLLLLSVVGRGAALVQAAESNTTDEWRQHRAALIQEVFGYGPGVLSNKSQPDWVLTCVWCASDKSVSPMCP